MGTHEISLYYKLSDLIKDEPWVEDLRYLPNGPVLFLPSRNRTSRGLENLLSMMHGSISSCVTVRQSNVYILAARKVWAEEGTVRTKMGLFMCAEKKMSLGIPFQWSAEHVLKCASDNIVVGLAQIDAIVIDHLRFASRFPVVFLFGSLEKKNASQWLGASGREIIVNAFPYDEIRFNIATCLRLFPSENAAGLVISGSEDFGGFFAFGFGALAK